MNKKLIAQALDNKNISIYKLLLAKPYSPRETYLDKVQDNLPIEAFSRYNFTLLRCTTPIKPLYTTGNIFKLQMKPAIVRRVLIKESVSH